MHAQHDRNRGWNPFWAALGAALLVLVPLVGGTLLLTLNGVEEKIPVSRRRVSALKKALGL